MFIKKTLPFFVLISFLITASGYCDDADLLVGAGIMAAKNNAQESATIDSLTNTDRAEIATVARVIPLTAQAADEKIKAKTEEILIAANQYTALQVSVNKGLASISGATTDRQYIDWATDIAKNIDGVVAVINNVKIKNQNYFSVAIIKNELLSIWVSVLEIVPRVIFGFIVLAIFLSLASPLSGWLMVPFNRENRSQLIHEVFRRALSLILYLMGFYFFLRIAGLTQFALAIISGTGVIGLVLGFAFRDIAENFIASLLISAQRPFRIGDVIEVQGHVGVVQKVTARGTTLVDYDGNHIQIPNAIVYKNIIQNLSANPRLRGKFSISIGYDASIKLAQEIGIKIMLEHEAVLNDPEPQVLVDSLGSSSIILKIYFWVDSEVHSVLKVSSLLMRLIMREFEKNGITMPDDAREIIFPNGVPLINSANAPHTNDGKQESALHSPSTELKTTPSLASPLASPRATSTPALKVEEKTERNVARDSVPDSTPEDISSDTENIRQQANNARTPEEGKNIL